MGKSTPPKPADPAKTALAQGALNFDQAAMNTVANMQNQVGPDGSVTYDQSGTRPVYQSEIRDADGKVIRAAGYIDMPSYTQTTSLSPEQQAIKAQQDGASLNLASLGNNLSGQLGEKLTDNFTLGDFDAFKQRDLLFLSCFKPGGNMASRNDQCMAPRDGEAIPEA